MLHLLRILIAAVALLGAAAAPASAADNLELAVQDDPVLYDLKWGDRPLTLDRTAQLGAERIRVNVRWADSMPAEQARSRTKPAVVQWDFSKLESLWAHATARGLRLQVSLTGPAPRWGVNSWKVKRTRGFIKPKARLYGEFVSAAAQRFARRIDRWAIWNEPNWKRLLGPAKSAPARYRALYRAGYEAVKTADPAAQVLFGEMMPGANRRLSTPVLAFLRKVACVDKRYKRARKCAPLYADGFALHPYNFARAPRKARNRNTDIVEIGSLSRLVKALDRLHRAKRLRTPSGARMPILLTEFGYFTAGALKVSPRRHASWMRQAWRIAERNPRVTQLLQYGLIEPWFNTVTWRSAIMKKDATPRRVYFALQKLAR